MPQPDNFIEVRIKRSHIPAVLLFALLFMALCVACNALVVARYTLLIAGQPPPAPAPAAPTDLAPTDLAPADLAQASQPQSAPPTFVPLPTLLSAPPTSALAPTGAATTRGRLGERLAAGGVALTVLRATRTPNIGETQRAQSGTTFILAEVALENTAGDDLPLTAQDFIVRDDDGIEYVATPSSDAQALGADTLRAGGQVRGTLAFQIRENAVGLSLIYQPRGGIIEPFEIVLP